MEGEKKKEGKKCKMLWALSNMAGMVTTNQVPTQKLSSAQNFNVSSTLDAPNPCSIIKHMTPKNFFSPAAESSDQQAPAAGANKWVKPELGRLPTQSTHLRS